MKSVCWMLLASCAFLCASLALAGGGGAGEAKRLQGKWVGDDEGVKVTLEFSKEAFSLVFEGRDSFKGTFKINTDKKPYHLDMTVSEGSESKFKGKTALCLWEISGDTLKWCSNQPGRDVRPTELSDKGVDLFIQFKRTK